MATEKFQDLDAKGRHERLKRAHDQTLRQLTDGHARDGGSRLDAETRAKRMMAEHGIMAQVERSMESE